MTTAKNDNYNLKIFIYFWGGGFFDFRWGGNKNLVWREGIFPGGGGDDQIFGWWEGTPPSPQ